MARDLPDPPPAEPGTLFGDRVSRGLRWAIVVAAAVLPYAGPRLAHAARHTPPAQIAQHSERSAGAPLQAPRQLPER